MQTVATAVSVVLLVLQLSTSCTQAVKESSLEGERSGEIACPCFCSDRGRPYWQANFKDDYVDGTACATPCGVDTSALAYCGTHINYRFCARRMDNHVNHTTVTGVLNDQILRELDGHVKACTEDLVWDIDETDECFAGVKLTACNFAFPKCSDEDDEAQDLCRSTCENEKRACRSLNSNFGSNEQITLACAGAVDDVGPSVDCTGGGSTATPQLPLLVAAMAAALLAAAALVA